MLLLSGPRVANAHPRSITPCCLATCFAHRGQHLPKYDADLRQAHAGSYRRRPPGLMPPAVKWNTPSTSFFATTEPLRPLVHQHLGRSAGRDGLPLSGGRFLGLLSIGSKISKAAAAAPVRTRRQPAERRLNSWPPCPRPGRYDQDQKAPDFAAARDRLWALAETVEVWHTAS